MIEFKTSVGGTAVYPLDRKTYRQQTEISKNLHKEENGKDSYYAVCPLCENPVVIVNLLKTTKNIYGRHGNKSGPHLAKLDIASRNSCKYFTGGANYKERQKVPKGALSDSLYQQMKDNFDIVALFFEKTTGIRVSLNKVKEIFVPWINDRGYEYFCCTDSSLMCSVYYEPWEFNLFGQLVRKGSIAHELLTNQILKPLKS